MSTDQTQPNSSDTPADPSKPRLDITPPRRVRRGFWSWLRRDPDPSPTIVQIMAEWAEYQLVFNDMLTRFSAMLARQAKMEKKKLERELQEAPPEVAAPVSRGDVKSALRSQYAYAKYGGRIQEILAAKESNNEHDPSDAQRP